MIKVNLKITIDSRSRRIEVVYLEGIAFAPNSIFRFVNGQWEAKLSNFSLGPDNDLDVLIITVGNPNTQSEMKVYFNNTLKATKSMYQPFNRNGYGQFNTEIK